MPPANSGPVPTHHISQSTRNSVLQLIPTLIIAAVAVVLLMGLYNMMKGGSANLSQKLMRWRVGLQFLAVVALMATAYAFG